MAVFQDLIIVIWAEPTDFDAQSEFAAKVVANRYRESIVVSWEPLVDIKDSINEWIPRKRYSDGGPPTVWLGFQGTGWHLKEFHDIINLATTLPAHYPKLKIEWLPDNWFHHTGMAPTLQSGADALEWLEQQVVNSTPETIKYYYKGADPHGHV